MIIHLHFHRRATGVTRSIINIFPLLNKYSDARVFGYGIKVPKTNLFSLLRLAYSGDKMVIHAHRNNEMLFALLIRLLRGKFKLVFTRHAESQPSGFTSFLMKKADCLVSLSLSMAESLPYPNTLIRHGVDTELFKIHKKTRIGNIAQENLISVIGRIRPAKGQLVVLKALVPLLRTNPGWGLLFTGKTDSSIYAREITSIIEKNDISSQVHIMPETDHITDYYSSSTAVVIASFSEGFSLVCLEAMSCGLVTIATASVGIHSEAIKNGENGFLFPAGDHISLRKIISDIISKNTTLEPEKIRQTILDNWSLEKSVRELLKLYDISPL